MTQIITRKGAMARGLKFYFNGQPCANGHIGQRYTIDTKCRECTRKFYRLRGKTSPQMVNCKQCGCEFVWTPSHYRKPIYCSAQCRREFWLAAKRKNSLNKTCAQCGALFCTPYQRKITCSDVCAAEQGLAMRRERDFNRTPLQKEMKRNIDRTQQKKRTIALRVLRELGIEV